MGRIYKDPVLMAQAERLFVRSGMTIGQIAAEMPEVAERTLYNWSSEGQWVKKREKRLRQAGEVGDLLEKIKLTLARECLADDGGIDPQKIYALSNAVTVLSKSAKDGLDEWRQEQEEMDGLSDQEKMEKVREYLGGYGVREQA